MEEKFTLKLEVSEEEERAGLDVSQHGEEAYMAQPVTCSDLPDEQVKQIKCICLAGTFCWPDIWVIKTMATIGKNYVGTRSLSNEL